MARRPKPIDTSVKPTYIGERSSASNTKDRHHCARCRRLATHRAQFRQDLSSLGLVQDTYLCPTHSKKAVIALEIHRVRELPEYRKYLKRVAAWEEAKRVEEMPQEVLF